MLHSVSKLLGVIMLASVLVSCSEEETPVRCVLTPEEVVIPISEETGIDATWQAVLEARVVVVFVPTVGYTQASWQATANRVNEQRWSSLRIEPRPTPQPASSTGAPWRVSRADSSRTLLMFTEDILASIEWIEQKVGPNAKIILVGADLGGVAALRAAANARSVYGVALLSPPASGELLSQDVIQAYGDRPLLVMTELPIEPTMSTPRTLDTWLGRGSTMSLQLSEQTPPTRLEDRAAAQRTLFSWILKSTL
jgi:pimeloyl-ACP methyl ester carboxylesterase